ncbi:hypothetical protein [Kingella negevensis]|uniref:hypothetical protein n=1 Tax=Kingella negevensis TaxID=1522312 RepID=UPI00050A30F2|nr:hypothetical protein [Kingella negevensis]
MFWERFYWARCWLFLEVGALHSGKSMKKWKRLLQVMCISVIALTLTACANLTHSSKSVDFRLPEMPLNVSRECESLNELADTRGETVIFWAVDTVGKYKDCAEKQRAAVQMYQSVKQVLENGKE